MEYVPAHDMMTRWVRLRRDEIYERERGERREVKKCRTVTQV